MSKILILTPFYPPNIGGAETFIDALCKEAMKCHDVTVLTFQPFKGKAQKYEESLSLRGGSLKIHRMKWPLSHAQAWKGIGLRNLISTLPKMVMGGFILCAKERFDVIHAQGLISGLAAIVLKKIFKCKVYITLLAIYEFEKYKNTNFRRVSKWIMNNCDLVFVEGNKGLEDIRSLVDRNKVRIFQHWCDHEVFKPIEDKSNEKMVVLFVGRPIPEKGRHVVEEAERLINSPERVNFIYVDNVPYEELVKYYQMAHIVVVPSLYPEGYSRVVIESSSCGCALIVSNRGSLPEMVDGWGTVFGDTAQELSYHIERMPIWLMGEKAYEYAKKNFSSKNAEVFINEYSNV